jgi:membrane associated rhomboid family serine protease
MVLRATMPQNVLLAPGGPRADVLFAYGHFSTFEVATWAGGIEFWRFLTFQFLHANIMHIFFNMLGLYMFGAMVEDHLGPKKYVAFYLTCGIFGGFLYLVLNLAGQFLSIPGVLINDTRTPLIGASAGVFGVIMACAKIAPNTVVQLILPPVPLKMRTMAYAYVGISFASLLLGTNNAGGEAAHIGGAIAGYFFIRNSHLLRDFFDVFTDSRRPGGRSKLRLAGDGPDRVRASTRASEELAAEEAAMDRDLNRILDRVKEVGSEGLTDEERATLERVTRWKRGEGRGRPAR